MAKVSGYSLEIVVTPTVSTSPAYTAGDQVGGIQTLPGACLGRAVSTLLSVSVVDKASQNAALTIFFFNQLPTIASSDNAAFDLTDANMLNCVGAVTIAATDYQSSSSNSVATIKMGSCGLAVMSSVTDSNSGALYAVAKTTGTPTYASTTDLQFRYVFGQDL